MAFSLEQSLELLSRTPAALSAMRSLRSALMLLLVGCGQRAPTGLTLAITHVSIVDVRAGTTIPDQTVVIRGRRIASVGDAGRTSIPDSAQLLDGRGKYLIPGFWDMHVHLDSAALPALVHLGITGARDMGGDLEELLIWRRRINADSLAGPRLVFAGPALHGPRSPGETGPWVIRTEEQGRRAVDSLAARHVDFIKIHEGLLQDAYNAIAREATRHNLPFAGHVPAGVTVGDVAYIGQRSIEHLEFVPDVCLGRFAEGAGRTTPLPSQCSEADLDDLLGILAAQHTWLCPTIGSFRIFAPKQFPAIFAGFKDLVPLLRARHIGLLAGTDLGTTGIIPGASLHDELALLVDAGFTPAEVLRAATLSPAQFLGIADSLGTVERGKIADVVLLDGNPLTDIRNTRAIAAVIQAGRRR
jgi:imidazolonepropionase-like amidohydrolase